MTEEELLQQLTHEPVNTHLIMHYYYPPDFKTYTLTLLKTSPDGWTIRRNSQTAKIYSNEIIADTVHQLYVAEHVSRISWQFS